MSDKPGALAEGELWSLFRSIMSQGASIGQDYQAGVHATYEHYSARLDAAAAERQQEFWAAHIAPLHAECERLRADAERYRWLRATTNFATNSAGERIDVRNKPDLWDAAIDAARKEQA